MNAHCQIAAPSTPVRRATLRSPLGRVADGRFHGSGRAGPAEFRPLSGDIVRQPLSLLRARRQPARRRRAPPPGKRARCRGQPPNTRPAQARQRRAEAFQQHAATGQVMPNQVRVGVATGEAEGLQFLLERGNPVHTWRQRHLEDHRPGVGGDRLDNVRRVASIERTAISDRPVRGQAGEDAREIPQPARPSRAEGCGGDTQPVGHSDRVHKAQLSARGRTIGDGLILGPQFL